MFDGNCTVSSGNASGFSLQPQMTVPLVTFTTSSVGNLIAIFVIRRNQQRARKKSVFYTLVMTLALLDLVSTWVTSPITFAAYTMKRSVCHLGGWMLCHYSGTTMLFFGIVTMAVVFTMSVERMIAIRFAFYYHTNVNAKKTQIVVISITLACLVFSLFPLVGFGEIVEQPPGSWCFLNWKATEVRHQVFSLTTAIVGLAMLMGTIICNAYVITCVIKKRRKMKICNSAIQVMSKQRLRKLAIDELQMIALLAVMTCVFIVCYFPLLFRILVTQITTICSIEDQASSWGLFAVRMASINPVLDPWVYILCRRPTVMGFYNLVKMLLTCKCSKRKIAETFSHRPQFHRGQPVKMTKLSKIPSRTTSNCEAKQMEVAAKYGKQWKLKAKQSITKQDQENLAENEIN